jgi:hypothetical protein
LRYWLSVTNGNVACDAGGQPHLFNPVVQFNTAVMGLGGGSQLGVLIGKCRLS